MSWALLIHGGAGGLEGLEASKERAITEALQAIIRKTARLLDGGGAALEAVQLAVTLLEDNPLFNAGRGSSPDAAGNITMDAAIMEGKTRRLGGCASVQGVQNPVTLARLVMEQTPHVLMVGEEALKLAVSHGLEVQPAGYFLEAVDGAGGVDPVDTVGAVVLDEFGGLAAATSTGGLKGKLPGRVGDSPIAGAGLWVDERTAFSATGRGEDFLRTCLCKHAADLFAWNKMDLQEALNQAVGHLGETVSGSGGLIGVDGSGTLAWAANTPVLIRAGINSRGESFTGLKI